MVLIVLDINGVLGEVRKSRVAHKVPDVVLPTRQVFYSRPDVGFFLWTCSLKGPVALWTSRKQVNAAPIEQYLKDKQKLGHDTICLHGEDCPRVINFRPIKDVSILRRKYPQYAKEHVIFVDDSPEKIILDSNSQIVKVQTYNAGDSCYASFSETIDKLDSIEL